MSYWLAGKALAPFVLMLLVACVTRPAQRWVERNLADTWLKRLLLVHSERDKRAYAIGCAVLLIGLYGGIAWACSNIRH